jgi:uncharacterized membrane protein
VKKKKKKKKEKKKNKKKCKQQKKKFFFFSLPYVVSMTCFQPFIIITNEPLRLSELHKISIPRKIIIYNHDGVLALD